MPAFGSRLRLTECIPGHPLYAISRKASRRMPFEEGYGEKEDGADQTPIEAFVSRMVRT